MKSARRGNESSGREGEEHVCIGVEGGRSRRGSDEGGGAKVKWARKD